MLWGEAAQTHGDFEQRAIENNDGYWLQHRFSCNVWETPPGKIGATTGDWVRNVTDPTLLLVPCQLRIM